MAVSTEFAELVREMFAPLGDVRTRRMFGGMGVYCDERMFALIDDDQLFLKVDDETRTRFEAAGLQPFRPEMKSEPRGVMPYSEAPEEMFDDPDAALEWGRLAFDAALRAAAKKKPKSRKAKSATRAGPRS